MGGTLFVINAGVSRVAMSAGIEPTSFTSLRILGAAAVFAIWIGVRNPQFFRPPRGRELIDIILLGIFGVLIVQLGYNIALTRLPVGIALLLEYLAPVWVVLWVRFARKEPVRKRMWFAVALAVLGMGIVGQVWQGIVFDGIGVIAGLVAGLGFAIYFLLGETNISRSDPLFVIFWSFTTAALAMNVIWPFWTASGWTTPANLQGPFGGTEISAWVLLIWVVVAGTVVPFFLQLKALHYIPPTMVTMVAMMEPVGAIILGWFWFDEVLNVSQLLGAGTILIAIILAQTARIKHPAEIPATN